jgi:hypothetical protein
MKVRIINSTTGWIEVHREGCRDIGKAIRNANSDWPLDVPDGESVAEAVVADLNRSFGWEPGSEEPQPWHEHDIKLLPCVGKA